MSVFIGDEQLQEAIVKRFQCTRCGHCCKGDGVVRFGPEKADEMARTLGINRHKLLTAFALLAGEKEWWLKDKMVYPVGAGGPEEKWCIFLEQGSDGLYYCRVNQAKPQQCADFPAKWQNMDSTTTCSGLGRLVSELRQRPETLD